MTTIRSRTRGKASAQAPGPFLPLSALFPGSGRVLQQQQEPRDLNDVPRTKRFQWRCGRLPQPQAGRGKPEGCGREGHRVPVCGSGPGRRCQSSHTKERPRCVGSQKPVSRLWNWTWEPEPQSDFSRRLRARVGPPLHLGRSCSRPGLEGGHGQHGLERKAQRTPREVSVDIPRRLANTAATATSGMNHLEGGWCDRGIAFSILFNFNYNLISHVWPGLLGAAEAALGGKSNRTQSLRHCWGQRAGCPCPALSSAGQRASAEVNGEAQQRAAAAWGLTPPPAAP